MRSEHGSCDSSNLAQRTLAFFHRRENALAPIGAIRIDHANIESELLAFELDTARVIDMQIDAERVRMLRRQGIVAETGDVSRVIDDIRHADAVQPKPPPNPPRVASIVPRERSASRTENSALQKLFDRIFRTSGNQALPRCARGVSAAQREGKWGGHRCRFGARCS